MIRNKLFYFYAYDQQARNFPAISTPADPNFYALTATQRALLGNRGVTPAKVNAALNYLESLSGTIPRRQDQTVNFGKVDWQAAEHHRVSVQYDRARSSSPAGVRSAPVVDVGRASMGSSYGKVDGLLGRWIWYATPRLSEELRCSMEGICSMSRHRLRRSLRRGPGGVAPEIAIGPNGFTFGSSPSLGRKSFPDENKVQLADMVTWTRGRH